MNECEGPHTCMGKSYLCIGSIFVGVEDGHIDRHLQADLIAIIEDESVVLFQSW